MWRNWSNILLRVTFQRTEFILDYSFRCFCYNSFLDNKNCFCGNIFYIFHKKTRELQHKNSAVLGKVILLRSRDMLSAIAAWVLEQWHHNPQSELDWGIQVADWTLSAKSKGTLVQLLALWSYCQHTSNVEYTVKTWSSCLHLLYWCNISDILFVFSVVI